MSFSVTPRKLIVYIFRNYLVYARHIGPERPVRLAAVDCTRIPESALRISLQELGLNGSALLLVEAGVTSSRKSESTWVRVSARPNCEWRPPDYTSLMSHRCIAGVLSFPRVPYFNNILHSVILYRFFM